MTPKASTQHDLPSVGRTEVEEALATQLIRTDPHISRTEGDAIHHHRHLLGETVARLFRIAPKVFSKRDPSVPGLGATLYTPASRPNLAATIADLTLRVGLTSTVLCLEDSIADDQLASAEANLVRCLQALAWSDVAANVLIRPRTPAQLLDISTRIDENLGVVNAFVLPKFAASNAGAWINALVQVRRSHPHLTAMPILEGSEVLHSSTRIGELDLLEALFNANSELFPVVRIGATDLCGLLGIRRGQSSTVYDVAPIATVIGDIVARWSGAGSSQVLTGAVWEYYRQPSGNFDLGLVRETQQDIECGMLGKSVIHPSHVRVVNSLLTVSARDFDDATSILVSSGGVTASSQRDRMNEAKPHHNWAVRILRRSEVFGVLHEGVEPYELISAV